MIASAWPSTSTRIVDVGFDLEGPRDCLRVGLQMFVERVGGAFRRPAVSPVEHLEQRRRIRTGSGRSTSVLKILKMAVVAPIPSASDTTAVAVNAGLRRKPPQAVPKILSQPFPPDPHGRLPHVFADVGRIAERFQRRASSLVGGQPFADVLGRRLLDVKLQIGIELLIEHAACKQRSNDLSARRRTSASSTQSLTSGAHVARIARLMAPDSRSHVSISFLRCARPERVSE